MLGINWVSNNAISNIDRKMFKNYIKYENKSIIETKVTSTLNENVLTNKKYKYKYTSSKNKQ